MPLHIQANRSPTRAAAAPSLLEFDDNMAAPSQPAAPAAAASMQGEASLTLALRPHLACVIFLSSNRHIPLSWQEAFSNKLSCMRFVHFIWHAMEAGLGCRADPFAELEGLDRPSTTAPAQQVPASGPGLDFDALYGLDTSTVQQPQPQQSSFLGGLDSFLAPAAQQSSSMADQFNAPSQRAGDSGARCTAWMTLYTDCPSIRPGLCGAALQPGSAQLSAATTQH